MIIFFNFMHSAIFDFLVFNFSEKFNGFVKKVVTDLYIIVHHQINIDLQTMYKMEKKWKKLKSFSYFAR